MSKILGNQEGMTIQALADIGNAVTREEVRRDYPIVAEFVDYIRWLAEQDIGLTVTVGDLWGLYYEGVRKCVYWPEVAEELGLPIRDNWE